MGAYEIGTIIFKVAAFVAANWVRIAIVAGQAYYNRRRRKQLERALRDRDIHANFSESVEYANIVFGERVLEQGTRVWSAVDTDNGTVTEVLAWMNHGRGGITGVTGVWLDDQFLPFDQDETATAANEVGEGSDFYQETVPGVGNRAGGGRAGATNTRWYVKDTSKGVYKYGSKLFSFKVYYGDQTVSDQVLVSNPLNNPSGYDLERVGRGIVYTIHTISPEAIQRNNGQVPELRPQFKGYKCHDPRPAKNSSYSDPSTWVETDNPAIIAAFVQTEFADNGTDGNVDWDRTASFADICDEQVVYRPSADDSAIVTTGHRTRTELPMEVGATFVATSAVLESGTNIPSDPGSDTRVYALTPPSSPADSGSLDDDWLSSGSGKVTKVTVAARSLAVRLSLDTGNLLSRFLSITDGARPMRILIERTVSGIYYWIDVDVTRWTLVSGTMYIYVPTYPEEKQAPRTRTSRGCSERTQPTCPPISRSPCTFLPTWLWSLDTGRTWP